MPDKYTQVEKVFINRELEEHAKYLAELYERDIIKQKLIKSELLKNLFVTVAPHNIFESSGIHHLQVKFPDYGRFIEIAYHKKRKKIKTEKDVVNPFIRKKKKKRVAWYTKNTFGAQNRLIGRLMYGFSDIIKEEIIREMEQKNK